MARTLTEDDKPPSTEGDPTCDHLGEGQVLEAFLDSALENDQVLRGILDEGMTQIIRGAISLSNLQRRRDGDRGHSRGNREERPVSFTPSSGGGEDDTMFDLLGEEKDPDAFLDSAFENDAVLRGILDEGLSQIIRGAIRLLNLQLGRRGIGQAQGHRTEKPPAPKYQKNGRGFDEGIKNSTVHGEQGDSFMGPEDNAPIATMTTGINSEEGEMVLKDPATSESQPDPTDESTFSEGGRQKLDGETNSVPAGKGGKGGEGPSKHCCYFCQKTFPSPSHLEIHVRTHTCEKPFPCNLCGKGFVQKGSLDEHIRRHLKEKWFKCSLPGCSSSFVGAAELKRHSRVHSGEKPFACPHPGCGKAFSHSSSLSAHTRVHSGEKPFACPHPGCGKAFSHSSSLSAHTRVHSGEKPFACPHPGCGKAFSHSSSLSAHTRVHSGEKPFACPHPGCGKAFSHSSSLSAHTRVHSGEKPFACPHPGCTSSFNNGSNLIRHAKLHSGEKPFACEYTNCGKRFTTKNSRDDRHRTHTGEKPFVCGCGKTFATSSNLRCHRKRCEEGDRRVTKKMKICNGAERIPVNNLE